MIHDFTIPPESGMGKLDYTTTEQGSMIQV